MNYTKFDADRKRLQSTFLNQMLDAAGWSNLPVYHLTKCDEQFIGNLLNLIIKKYFDFKSAAYG